MSRFLHLLFLTALVLVSLNSMALEQKIDTQKYKKVIVVAPQGGDFTDLAMAYDSIGTTSEKENVLIYIKPGIYDLSASFTALNMTKNYVDIQGAGQDLTVLRSNTANMYSSSFYMIMNGAISEIRDLTLELTSGPTMFNEYYVVGVSLSGGQQALRNVRINLNDTMPARQVVGGIDIRYSPGVFLENVTVTVNSATYNWYFGMFSDGGNVSANNLQVVSNGTYGIFAGYSGANLSLTNASIIANNGSALASYGGNINANTSYISGGTTALSLSGMGSAATIANSTLIGSIWEGAPGSNQVTISNCVNGEGTPVTYP